LLLGEAGFWQLIRTEMMKTLRGFFYGLMGITLLGSPIFGGLYWFFLSKPREIVRIELPEREAVTARVLGGGALAVAGTRRVWVLDLPGKAPPREIPLDGAREAAETLRPEVQRQFTTLSEERARLDTRDSAAVSAFNQKAAAYQSAKERLAELDRKTAARPSETGFEGGEAPRVYSRGDRLWIVGNDRIAVVNWRSGKLLDQRPVADTPASCTELPGGLVVTASLERFGPGVATLCGFDRDRLIQYRVDAAEGVEDSAARNRPRWVTRDTQFGISGNRVLQFDVRLTRRNLVSKRAIKAYRPEAAEEVPGGGAEAALAIAEVVERDAVMEETGGVVWVDESEYQVTLRRLDGAPAQVWQGTAQGMPRLWTLGTLALVMDGKRVTALNANNEKLWETRLSYPPLAAAPGDRDGAEIPPCIEASGVVYVWDAGSLAALDAASPPGRCGGGSRRSGFARCIATVVESYSSPPRTPLPRSSFTRWKAAWAPRPIR